VRGLGAARARLSNHSIKRSLYLLLLLPSSSALFVPPPPTTKRPNERQTPRESAGILSCAQTRQVPISLGFLSLRLEGLWIKYAQRFLLFPLFFAHSGLPDRPIPRFLLPRLARTSASVPDPRCRHPRLVVVSPSSRPFATAGE
jgi:hypothetical protein